MKVLKVLFIYGLFLLLNMEIKANRIMCRYGTRQINLEQKSFLVYCCYLNVQISTNNAGQHLYGYDDSKVSTIYKANDFTITQLTSQFCEKFRNLQIINFLNEKIFIISQDAFKNCPSLKYLFLGNNKIKEVPSRAFDSNSKLVQLDLSSNEIENLPPNIFSNLIFLKVLDLSKNKLMILKSTWFENLQSLETLNLALNGISDLQENLFGPLSNLKFLELSFNNITIIHSKSFGEHQKLTKVNLANNKIGGIDEKLIDQTAIEELNLESNECISKRITSRNRMKIELKECFEQYKRLTKDGKVHVSCGKRIVKDDNLPGGIPWAAALMLNHEVVFGAATLITKNKVLTAAHCILGKGQYFIGAEDLSVILGAFNVSFPQNSSNVIIDVKDIDVHPDYRIGFFEEKFDADIAMLTLDKDVQFNMYIQPICIMMPDFDLRSISNGYTFAYGLLTDDNKNILSSIDTPFEHSNEECFYTHPKLLTLSSKRTFCGGRRDGTGHCTVSGAGLIINEDDTFFLHGISSAFLFSYPSCDLNNYSIYTNVSMHFNWIKSKIEPSDFAKLYIKPSSSSKQTIKQASQNPNLTNKQESSNSTDSNDQCNRIVTEGKNNILSKCKQCFKIELTERQENDRDSCGRVKIGNIKTKSDGKFAKGSFPWFARLIHNEEFISSGTLISSKHVITTANSIIGKEYSNEYLSRDILVVLGAHNENQIYENGKITCAVESIEIHPDWNPNIETYDGDIAILILETEVIFSNFIQPICLIEPDLKVSSINEGIVAGYWINDEYFLMTENIPRVMKFPIHSNEDCFYKDEEYLKFSSRRTFCGGYANDSSLCVKGSGDGLYVSDGEAYYLRGMISKQMISDDEYDCRNTYTIFTDVSKFNNWIRAIMSSTKLSKYGYAVNIDYSQYILINEFIEKIYKATHKLSQEFNFSEANKKCLNDIKQIKSRIDQKLHQCFSNESIRSYKTNCGQSKILRGKIKGGSQIIHGSFPWIVALIQKTTGEYFCGGTIVSNNKIVTAAHCILSRKHKFKPEDIFVLIGVHDLKDPNEIGRMTVGVERITPHNHWNPKTTKYDADIAIIILKKNVLFTDYIQPICLSMPYKKLKNSPNGYVVGYGKDENSNNFSVDIPKIINTPIFEFNNCSNSHPDLEDLLTHRTFCGGYGNGSGTCIGDSGSGLYALHDDRYFLRGIVSASLYKNADCNAYKPSVFTDTLEFFPFINTGKAGKRVLN